MHVFYVPDLTTCCLPEDEATHAVRVLRLSVGAPIFVTNGSGLWCSATLQSVTPRVNFTINKQTRIAAPDYYVHLAVAPAKNHDRMEWLVEKATEIGIREISFIQTKKTERKHIQPERLNKIAVAAIKQSQQAWLPKINPQVPFEQALTQPADARFIAHVGIGHSQPLARVAPPGKKYLVLIGPEGDFTAEELAKARESGFQQVSLGPNRLRTETAALAACLTLHLINT